MRIPLIDIRQLPSDPDEKEKELLKICEELERQQAEIDAAEAKAKQDGKPNGPTGTARQ